MKSLFCAALAVLCFVCVADAQIVPRGYRMVCQNGICSLQRNAAAFAPTVYGVSSAAPAVTTVSFSPTIASVDAAPPLPAAAVTVTASRCNCFQTGICTCDRATCMCPNCPDEMANLTRDMQAAPAVQYASGTPYTYYNVAAPTVMYAAPAYAAQSTTYATGTGFVTRSYDAFGNVYVSHTGGARQRKLARQEMWRARRGIP